ncbi:hypothetical protein [Lysobacter fragariae]
MKTKHPDADLIAAMGGPSELARKLGFDLAKGGVQRVQNWTVRGIPVLIKYQHPEIFGAPPASRQPTAANEGEEAAETDGDSIPEMKEAA